MQYENIRKRIKGPVFPIVTPFTHDDHVDHQSICRYIDFLYRGGARIFHVMIHTSRFGLLLPDEMKGVNATVARHVRSHYPDTLVIAAAPIYGPTSLCIDFARHAEACGADLIGVYFWERYYSDTQVIGFFKEIAESCRIGVLIHEQQMNTIHGSNLSLFPLHLLDQLADIENIIAIKEDAKEDDYTDRVVDTLKDRLAIIVSGGSKEQFMLFGPKGCQAYLVGVASFFPHVGCRFYDAFQKGDAETCQWIIDRIERPFFNVSKFYGWHVGLKAAMDYLGVMKKTERAPLQPLPSQQYKKIAKVVDRITPHCNELLADTGRRMAV